AHESVGVAALANRARRVERVGLELVQGSDRARRPADRSVRRLLRIDWGPDGRRLLVCHAGRSLRIHGLDGSVRELAPPVTTREDGAAVGGILDARWLADGRIVA